MFYQIDSTAWACSLFFIFFFSTTATALSLLEVLALYATWTSLTEWWFCREVDVFLWVQSNDERWNVHNLFAHAKRGKRKKTHGNLLKLYSLNLHRWSRKRRNNVTNVKRTISICKMLSFLLYLQQPNFFSLRNEIKKFQKALNIECMVRYPSGFCDTMRKQHCHSLVGFFVLFSLWIPVQTLCT